MQINIYTVIPPYIGAVGEESLVEISKDPIYPIYPATHAKLLKPHFYFYFYVMSFMSFLQSCKDILTSIGHNFLSTLMILLQLKRWTVTLLL